MGTYHYLCDGTKAEWTENGKRFYNIGSLVYVKQSETATPEVESFPFSGGRIVRSTSGNNTIFSPQFYTTDHLGSVRTIINASGTVIEANDYTPFGLRWETPSHPRSDNRYLFNGKPTLSCGYLDYGARLYSPRESRWIAMDQLAGKYATTSPYVYCLNNPVNMIDPDGRIVVDANGHAMWANGGWTAYATPDAIRIGNAMMLTRVGAARWSEMANARHPITLTINPAVSYNESGNLRLGRTNTTITDGNKVVVIEIFEGSLQVLVSPDFACVEWELPTSYRDYPTEEERIGAVSTHEGTHGVDSAQDAEREKRARDSERKYLKEIEQRTSITALKNSGFTFFSIQSPLRPLK